MPIFLVIFVIALCNQASFSKFTSGYNLVLGPNTFMRHGFLSLSFDIVWSLAKTEVANQEISKTLQVANRNVTELIVRTPLPASQKKRLLKMNAKNRNAKVEQVKYSFTRPF